MTHGHELRGVEWWKEWKCRAEWDKGEIKWDMYNSIINKIYLKICDLKGLPKFSNKMCLLKIKRRSKL